MRRRYPALASAIALAGASSVVLAQSEPFELVSVHKRKTLILNKKMR